MCKQCSELDQKIRRYNQLVLRITDPPLIHGINEVIAKSQAVKLALHEASTK